MGTINQRLKGDSMIDSLKGKRIRLKKINASLIVLLLLFSFSASDVFSQSSDSLSRHFNLDLRLKNMHLWQGSVVTPGAMLATSMEYTTSDKKFLAGLWGGASFDGSYKEFSYYVNYNFTSNFYAQIVSHNNYSAMSEPDMFSYDKYDSPNFLDFVLSYTVSDEIPLTAFWSTILFGQAGDFVVGDDGSVSNSYSNYVELKYRFFKDDDTQINAFAGGAFSFVTDETFYSSRPDFVNVGINMTQDVRLFSKSLPVTGTAFWNPHTGIGALQIDIMLF